MEASPAPAPRPTGVQRAARPRSSARALSAIGIGASRRCSRASCSDPATATLVFSYHEQVARVVELLDEPEPQTYDLCGRHADRTSPPNGWELSDTRPPPTDTPRRLDDEDTVAIIAAALRGDDTPRRVDVIQGGEDAPPTGRRVTVTTGATAPVVRRDGGSSDRDPLRAALEELQRVVEPDDRGATVPPLPFARRRSPALPPPPVVPPPGPPPAARDDTDRDRPTLW